MGKNFLQVVSYESMWSWLTNPMALLCGLSVCFTLYCNLFLLNGTIGMYSQLQVLPIYECCIIIGTLISGGIINEELQLYEFQQLMFIGVGSCIIMMGIMMKICFLEVDD